MSSQENGVCLPSLPEMSHLSFDEATTVAWVSSDLLSMSSSPCLRPCAVVDVEAPTSLP